MKKTSVFAVVAAQFFNLSHASPAPQWKDCPSGTQFYTCTLNNFHGCCSIDPCAVKSGCPDTSKTTMSPPSTSAGKSCPPGTKAYKQFNPSLRTIGSSSSEPSLFHIGNDTAKGIEIQQVFTFSNIPPTAQNIGLFWSISETVPQFTTKGPATASVVLLDSSKLDLSAPVLSSSQVSAAIDTASLPNGSVGGAGFGYWADPEFKKPHNHIIRGNGLPAKNTLSFWIAIKDQGEVVIRQTEQDGLYLQYDC